MSRSVAAERYADPADADEVTLDFTSRGNAARFCQSGWSTPEASETWTDGTESRVVLPTPTLRAPYILVLKLRPMVAASLPAQQLRVFLNNVLMGEFTLSGHTVRACLVPWAAFTLSPEVTISLEVPNAARPCDVGVSDDTRRLGVALSSMALYPDLHDRGEYDALFDDDCAAAAGSRFATAADGLLARDLMLCFESLGQNCEFGLVQRQCDAEPLGLLRFSSTPLPLLLDALGAGFEGMGGPGAIHVELSPNGREYMVRDSRFGFLYHAWVLAGAMAPEAIARREASRVPFLVRKLVEDLQAAEKIFVFKGMGAMPADEVYPLATAIRRYGANTLLFVTLADDANEAGSVRVEAPGFLIGYVDRFAPSDEAKDVLLDQWVAVCRQAYRLRLAAGLPGLRAAA
jgi:hypothetical protein